MFDKERANLVLKALNLNSMLPSEYEELERVKLTLQDIATGDAILDIWTVEDIQMRDSSIGVAEARDILLTIAHNMDAEVGINWDVIDSAIAMHDHEEY